MAAKPARIWLTRHGETEANRTGLFCGHSETALTAKGEEQSRALGRRLAFVPIVAVYTSDLGRAMRTAALAMEGRTAAVAVDADLREISYGSWEMRKESEIRRESPEAFELMRRENPAWQPPGGETTAMVRERMLAAITRIAGRHKHEEVLVVTHGTALQCLFSGILGMAETHVFRVETANCGLSCVDIYGERMVVSLLNERAHLEALATRH